MAVSIVQYEKDFMVVKTMYTLEEAHVYFSVRSFHEAWEFIEKAEQRSTEDNMTMLHTAIASLWHWTQREDVRPENLAAGYWQVSRVYNLLKQPHNARTYGMLSLQYARELAPFYQAYAYETLARAEMLCNNRVIMMVHLEKAYKMAEQIQEEEERQLLLKDLASIR